jgi:ATP-binding cassette subfamily F protein uup
MSAPIYYIKNGSLSFADKVVFEDIELYLHHGDKVCLIGRNGCGKSSLMKVINGDYEMDSGDLYQDPKTTTSYLRQDSKIDLSVSIYEFILKDLGDDAKYKADIIFEKLQIDGTKSMSSLSGGQLRRASLAKALVEEPEILLLDEPTNHLDITAIEWLEDYVKSYPGSVVCISHDRAFLNNVTNKLWWIDRGVLRKSDKGFKYFEEWQEQLLEHEEATLKKMQKKLDEENIWLSQGVTGRRKRNQKRLSDLRRLRETMREKTSHLASGKQKIEAVTTDEAKKMRFIIEAEDLCFGYSNSASLRAQRSNPEKVIDCGVDSSPKSPGNNDGLIIKDFSFRVKKGEKIGLIGPNGSGKSTLIKLLLKELEPESGRVRHGTELDVSYFDQHRTDLNPNHSLKQTLCPTGGDQIFLPDRTTHVVSYLRSFMFDPRMLNAKVSTLSGGEANRLLLSKALINPGNLFILDEPTNDLDMDTLEMLLEVLSDYTGTLIVVSHDRDFLEKLVTRTLVFTPDQGILDIIGGYDDYVKYYKKDTPAPVKVKKTSVALGLDPKVSGNSQDPQIFANRSSEENKPRKKLSYKDQRLLENIPGEIDTLEARIIAIEKELGSPTLYMKDPVKFAKLSDELQTSRSKIDELTETWVKIEEML